MSITNSQNGSIDRFRKAIRMQSNLIPSTVITGGNSQPEQKFTPEQEKLVFEITEILRKMIMDFIDVNGQLNLTKDAWFFDVFEMSKALSDVLELPEENEVYIDFSDLAPSALLSTQDLRILQSKSVNALKNIVIELEKFRGDPDALSMVDRPCKSVCPETSYGTA